MLPAIYSIKGTAMFRILRKLRKNASGTTAIEYGLIAAIVSVAAVVSFNSMGDSLNRIFDTISTAIDSNAAAP